MILSKVDLYNAHVDEWHAHGGDDERHRRLLKAARAAQELICYRWFGLSADAVRVPPASSVSSSGTRAVAGTYDPGPLARGLPLRRLAATVTHHHAAAHPS